MKRPMIIPAAAIAVGIISAYYIDIDHFLLYLLGSVALIWMIWGVFHNRISIASIFVFFILIGAFITNQQLSRMIKLPEDDYSSMIGVVLEENPSLSSTKFTIKLEQINGLPAEGKVLLRYFKNSPSHMIGDRIKIEAVAKRPLPNTNPLFFDYRLHLLTEGISYIIEGDRARVDMQGQSENIGHSIKRAFTGYVSGVFSSGLREENSRLIKGMILGNSSYLDEDDLLLYRNLGLAHLLAVSGLHIGIIAGSFMWLLSRIGLKRWISTIISILILILYGYVIGFPASASRGIFIFSMLYISRLIHRPIDRINLLSACMLILLIINPLWIFNSGFQLSFTATAGIVLLTDKIKMLFYPLNGKLFDSMAAIFAVNLGIIPIQAYWFNRFPILTVLSNMIIVPLASASLILGIMSLAASELLPILGVLLDIQRYAATIIDRIPIGNIVLPTPEAVDIVIYLLIITILYNWRMVENLDKNVKKSIALSFLLISLIHGIGSVADKTLQVDFIDVGQGDAALIQGPFGTYMVDGGGSRIREQDIGYRITLPYLEKKGITKLDAIFVSHGHEDHYRGLIPVIDHLKVGAVYVNGEPVEELSIKAKERDIPILKLTQGIRADLGTEASIEVLWPEKDGYNYLNENENSMVMVLEYMGKRILFTGDIENEAEAVINSSGYLDIDVLKVPHHGSNTSSSYRFLENFNPEYSIISVGRNNLYGHPSGDVVGRLIETGSEVLRTDEMGMIMVVISENGLEVIPFDFDKERPTIFEVFKKNVFNLIFIACYLILAFYMINDYRIRQGEFEWIF